MFIIGLFVSAGLILRYNKILKAERLRDAARVERAVSEISATRTKIRKQLFAMWAFWSVGMLLAPLWLPITGVSAGVRGDFFAGLAGAILVSVIIAFRLMKSPNHPTEPSPTSVTSAAEHPPRQP